MPVPDIPVTNTLDIGRTLAGQNRAIRTLNSRRIEADEIWAFCYAKAKNVPEKDRGQFGYGDVMRMGNRRSTRLTNAFSKKVANHAAAVGLQTLFYDFARPHKTLANPYPRTPAMAAGVADHIWTCDEVAALID